MIGYEKANDINVIKLIHYKKQKSNQLYIYIYKKKNKLTTKQIVTIQINKEARRSHATLVVLCL